MATLTISEARAILPELADRVQAGEQFTITRNGHPTMQITSVRETRSETDELWAMLDALREPIPPLQSTDISPLSLEYADQLAAQIRADRDNS